MIRFLQSINVLEGMIPSKEDVGILSAEHLQRLFVFALMWSIGATLELADRSGNRKTCRLIFLAF